MDLFSDTESAIAPGDGARLEALGTATTGPEAAADTGTARDEGWPPLVALILAIMLAEWALYERDGARRIWATIRGVGRRSGRATPAAGKR